MKAREKWGIPHKLRHLLPHLFLTVVAVLSMSTACQENRRERPADEVYVEASVAQSVPDWAPANTDPAIRYYFIPEIEVYYDAYADEYVYWNGMIWVYSPRLPAVHAQFNLYSANIVFLGPTVLYPWRRHSYYVATYPTDFFFGVNVTRYGHGWRCYDEGRHRFFVSHYHPHVYGKKHGFGHPHSRAWQGYKQQYRKGAPPPGQYRGKDYVKYPQATGGKAHDRPGGKSAYPSRQPSKGLNSYQGKQQQPASSKGDRYLAPSQRPPSGKQHIYAPSRGSSAEGMRSGGGKQQIRPQGGGGAKQNIKDRK